MKIKILILLLTVLVLTNAAAQASSQQAAAAEISFTYTRLSGSASNQFAVWIEDARGQHVKTLYVTKWTADGGWKHRPASIPIWVKKSDLANLTKAQVDAVSAATPRGTSTLSLAWDGTDSKGNAVPTGDYTIYLEGTLRWENQVLYSAPIRLGHGKAVPQVKIDYTGDDTADRGMIGDVKVIVNR